MTTKYGMFMEHTYLKPGVPDGLGSGTSSKGEGDATKPQEDQGPIDRDHGLNMKVTVGKTGKFATFSKYEYLPHPYTDPLKRKLQADKEKRKANVTEAPFKPGAPMKKSTTPGDFYGTSGKIPYMAGQIDEKKKKGEISQQPKGIYTSPAKKGGFGFNKTTLSERAGVKGVATEYEYQHDPEGVLKAKQREAAEADRKARVSELPFKPAAPPKKGGFGVPNTTISKGKGVAGEWEYVIAAAPASEPAKHGEGAEGAGSGAPFRPTNVFAAQRIEKIEYIHDPEGPKLKAEAEKKKAESQRLQATGAWKPTIGYKTDMVRSIVKMNLR